MITFAEYVQLSGKRTISTFGDSITAGASVPEPDRWSNRLAERLSLLLCNKGVSGTVLQGSLDADGSSRADNGYGRFRRDLLGDDRSELVAILYGTNDGRHTGAPLSINLAGFIRDYRAVLSGLIDGGLGAKDICIASPTYIPDVGFSVGDDAFIGQSRRGYQAFTEALRGLAQEFDTFYAAVNERMQTGGGDRLILPDHVHPNSAGHCVIAEAFAEATNFD